MNDSNLKSRIENDLELEKYFVGIMKFFGDLPIKEHERYLKVLNTSLKNHLKFRKILLETEDKFK